jgi:sugar phosphate permease
VNQSVLESDPTSADSLESGSSASARERALYLRVTLRIVPLLFVCYVVAFLDRINVGFAKLQMQDALGFSDSVYGLGAGIFFLSYCLLEVPSAMLLRRMGAKKTIARIMICWGIVGACSAFVCSWASLKQASSQA